jgi:hypothetical protein
VAFITAPPFEFRTLKPGESFPFPLHIEHYEWASGTILRQVVYSPLPSGQCRFRVVYSFPLNPHARWSTISNEVNVDVAP